LKVFENMNEMISLVESNMNIFIHGGAATPHRLIDGLIEESKRLRNVTLMHIHTHGEAKYANEEFKDSFNVVNFFVGGNIRKKLDYDRVDFLPCFLSEIPSLFKKGIRPVDVSFIHVSTPDSQGFCTLGTSVDVALSAVESSKIVIAQINPNMPRVHGDGFIHIDQIDRAIYVDDPVDCSSPLALTPEDMKIGELAASLIDNGATLQMGIGAIPDAVLHSLKSHKDLGIHTEMWSDGALELIKCGAVNNSKKKVHNGKTVSCFVVGSQEVYDFMNDNPSVIQMGSDYVNNPTIIKRNPKVAAINSAVEVDLTGQICADSVGHKIISGVGGQMDFMRGASLSEGGKPILVINSRSKKGIPKIVPSLRMGAGVVTTRSHVHYVVTEHGIAHLYGKTLNERAKSLIDISHPEDREMLERHWFDIYRNM